MNSVTKKSAQWCKEVNWIELIIYTIAVFLIFYRGTIYEVDSYAFIEKEINRSPGYIIFLSIFEQLFGKYFEIPVLIFQLMLNLYGVYILHACLNNLIRFQKLFSILSLLMLLAPILYLHLTANKIMSEALCYPLYLIFIAKGLYAVIEKNEKHLFLAGVTLLFLIFIRSQFLSLVPVGILVSGYLFYKLRKRKLILIGIFFLTIPFINNIMDKSFHYFQYGYFVSTPFTGPTMIASVFYVADEEDISLFVDRDQKKYFELVKKRLDDQNWTNFYANSLEYTSSFSLFYENYANISNQTVHEYGMRYYKAKGLSLNEQYIATNELTLRMYLPLLLDNFKSWLKLYIQNIKSALGSAKYLLLHLIVFGIGIYLMGKYDPKIGGFLVFILLSTLCNITLLAVATNSGKRYTFYNDWVIFVALFLFLDQYFKRFQKNAN